MKVRLNPTLRRRVRNLLEAARSCNNSYAGKVTAIELRRGAMRLARARQTRA